MINKVIFFIGTEAELIKLFPIMIEMDKRDIKYQIIGSGQNDIIKSNIMNRIKNNNVFMLSDEKSIRKTSIGLMTWFIVTFIRSKSLITNNFEKNELSESVFIVHGDTVSTLMGTIIGHRIGKKVYHVEAGLRSFNMLNPFPEEIDRVLAGKIADVLFAPGKTAYSNLKRSKCRHKVVNTYYNTIIDSLEYSRDIEMNNSRIGEFLDKKYFVFVMHRQENLSNKKLVTNILEKVGDIARNIHCVIIMHKTSEVAFRRYGLMDRIEANADISIVPRVEYFDFVKLLSGSQFVISDGGSNQEELAYMGKPCLVIRKDTERNDGLGKNAAMFDGNLDNIVRFAEEYKGYITEGVLAHLSPSKIITDYIFRELEN